MNKFQNFYKSWGSILLGGLVVLLLVVFKVDGFKSKVEPIQERASTKWKEEFFSSYQELKEGQKWHEIIEKGELALKEERATPEEVAEIHLNLSTVYYYLTEFATAKRHAAQCTAWGRLAGAPALEVRGLTNQSCIERAQVVRKLEGGSFDRATTFAEEAIYLYHSSGLENPYLLARAYYNLGATCDEDPCGSSIRALNAYQEASLIYRQCAAYGDLSRLANSIAECYLRTGQIDQAIATLEEAEQFEKSDRSRVDYAFVWAQIEKLRGRIDLSRQWAEEALDGAKQLTAAANVPRVEEFLANLDQEVAPPVQ